LTLEIEKTNQSTQPT